MSISVRVKQGRMGPKLVGSVPISRTGPLPRAVVDVGARWVLAMEELIHSRRIQLASPLPTHSY